MNVRSITPGELIGFASVGDHLLGPEGLARSIHQSWEDGKSRPEWCFIIEHEGQAVGRVAYEGTTLTPHEITMIALWLPWQGDYLTPGISLIRQSLNSMRAYGWTHVERRVLSTWDDAEKQYELLIKAGVPLAQEKRTYSRSGSQPIAVPDRLVFRSAQEAPENSISQAIGEIMEGTLDRVDVIEREAMGPAAHAEAYAAILKMVDDRPEWWQIACTQAGDFVGVVIPQDFGGGIGCINFIGVVPAQRGSGYSYDLLAKGTNILTDSGLSEIIADIDDQNLPMRHVFEKAEYTRQSGTLFVFLGKIDAIVLPG